MTTSRLFPRLVGAAGAAMLLISSAFAQNAYTVVQLADGPVFTALNNSGQAAGVSNGTVVYTGANGSGLSTIALPDGLYAFQGAVNINNLGQVAGLLVNQDFSGQGFYTSASGQLFTTSADGKALPVITGINDRGQMVGENGGGAPLISQDGRTWQTLPTLDISSTDPTNYSNNTLDNINNNGRVSGVTTDAEGNSVNFTANTDGSDYSAPGNSLNVVGGFASPGFNKTLNDLGQLVGNSVDADGKNNIVYLTGPNGVGISVVKGLLGVQGQALNNSGQLIGTGLDAIGLLTPMVTDANGQNAHSLNSLVSLTRSDGMEDGIEDVLAINDSGQLLVHSRFNATYLLTPVPEAPAGMLMLLGLSGLGLARRSKR